MRWSNALCGYFHRLSLGVETNLESLHRNSRSGSALRGSLVHALVRSYGVKRNQFPDVVTNRPFCGVIEAGAVRLRAGRVFGRLGVDSTAWLHISSLEIH